MKVHIKDWADAVKAALADSNNWNNWLVEDNSIFGIEREYGDWGMVVEGDEKGRYFYVGNYAYPMCVVDKLQNEKPNSDDVLRYGNIIKLDNFFTDTYLYIRISLVEYGGSLYYHKRVNGEIVEFRRVGKADE